MEMKTIEPVPGYVFNIREGTTDEQAVIECSKTQVYRKKGKLEVEPGDAWLDLGANVGGFAVHALHCGASVYAVEPEPENFAILQANVMNNDPHELGMCRQKAVVIGGMKELDLYLCKGDRNKYRHTLTPIRGREKITVKCVEIDHLLAKGFNGVKMDIEGAEMEIFDNIEDWHAVKKLAFEYHFDRDRSVENFERRMAKLREHFPNVDYPKIPEGIKEYNFYPPARIVHCYF